MQIHLVDDEPTVREVVADILDFDGYKVRSFEDGQAYIDYMNSGEYRTPLLVITDIDMPRVNGFDLINHIRNQTPDCKILIVSGHEHHQAQADQLDIPMLKKPFPPEQLLNLVAKFT